MSPEFHFDPFSIVVKKRRFRNSKDKLFGVIYLIRGVSFLYIQPHIGKNTTDWNKKVNDHISG